MGVLFVSGRKVGGCNYCGVPFEKKIIMAVLFLHVITGIVMVHSAHLLSLPLFEQ